MMYYLYFTLFDDAIDFYLFLIKLTDIICQ